MKAPFVIFAAVMLSSHPGITQSLPDSTINRIDNLFRKWDKPNSPGCVVGIIRNDSLLYSKGYGLANLEDSIPNTPRSVYYICSLAKQFTGYAIVLLARQGKLKLDNDIRLYLPWMTDFGHKITIRNLCNHTSGIRDENDMADIAGFPPDGILTQAFALDLLKKQRSLNFVPGEKHSYSNSNYILLADIVKVVSGQRLADFVDSAIFKPLGMAQSRIVEDDQDLIKRRAASYSSGNGGHFKNRNKIVYVLGAGGLYTDIDDMAHWVMNFYSPVSGDAKDIAMLTERGRLNDGEEINYALGISVDSSKGWKRFSHNGGMAGYRTVIAVYPDLHLGFLIFANSGDNETYSKIGGLESIFIPDRSPAKVDQASVDSTASILRDPAVYEKFAGYYLADNGNQRKFSIQNSRLWMNNSVLMRPENGTTFAPLNNPIFKYTFHVESNGDTSLDLTRPGLSVPIHFIKMIKAMQLPDNELKTYSGTYYSPELDCSYHVILRDRQLYLSNFLHDDAKMILMGRDDLLTDFDPLYHLKVIRNKARQIIGLEVNSDETMHLRFNKVE